MSGNSIGKLFTVTSFGESHGLAIGCIVDGCPPGLEISASDLQPDLDRRKPGQSRYTTQRKEDDEVKILSGVFEGRTTGASIGMMIENKDQKSKDYSKIKDLFRPSHADYTYHQSLVMFHSLAQLSRRILTRRRLKIIRSFSQMRARLQSWKPICRL